MNSIQHNNWQPIGYEKGSSHRKSSHKYIKQMPSAVIEQLGESRDDQEPMAQEIHLFKDNLMTSSKKATFIGEQDPKMLIISK